MIDQSALLVDEVVLESGQKTVGRLQGHQKLYLRDPVKLKAGETIVVSGVEYLVLSVDVNLSGWTEVRVEVR